MSTTDTFHDSVRAATELLESIVADRGLLARLSAPDRKRLVQAAGQVFNPDHIARRRLVKAAIRERKAAMVQQVEGKLTGTGIRRLRRQDVFTTPNVYPPDEFIAHDSDGDPEERVTLEPQHC